MSNVIKLKPSTGKLTSDRQLAIKKDIDFHNELSSALHNLERIILQDVQTVESENALLGLGSILRWNYDKTQRLSDSL